MTLLVVELIALGAGGGYLVWRMSRKRAPSSATPSSLGIRLVFYVGVTAIIGILLLWPGGPPTAPLIFFIAVLPISAWTIITDIRWNRRDGRGARTMFRSAYAGLIIVFGILCVLAGLYQIAHKKRLFGREIVPRHGPHATDDWT